MLEEFWIVASVFEIVKSCVQDIKFHIGKLTLSVFS